MVRLGEMPPELVCEGFEMADKEYAFLASLGYTGSLADKRNAYYNDLITNGGDSDLPTVGEIVPSREFLTTPSATPVASGTVALSYWTARRTETITQVTTYTGGTAAGATPTLCRVGVYSVASNGDLTLTASIANDTALWASTNTAYTRSFTSSWTKTVGQRYAFALIVVTGAAIPVFLGTNNTSIAVAAPLFLQAPTISSRITGQTDLPASIAAASLTGGFSIRIAANFS